MRSRRLVCQKLLDLIIWLTFFYLASTPIHEFFHWWVGKITGATMTRVTYSDWFSGFAHYSSQPNPLWPFFIAGGVGTGLVFLMLGWRAWLTPTKWDDSIMFCAFLIGGAQIGYGVGELSLAYDNTDNWFPLIASAGAVIGALVPIILLGPRICRWLTKSS